jgi:hypothetical protein
LNLLILKVWNTEFVRCKAKDSRLRVWIAIHGNQSRDRLAILDNDDFFASDSQIY